jgi:signal transduction histidine kinase
MTAADSGLRFGDAPRLELDQLLEQLRDRATDVLATQGRLRGLLRANAAVAEDLSLSVVLHRIVQAARELVDARQVGIAVTGPTGAIDQFVHTDMDPVVVAGMGIRPSGDPGPASVGSAGEQLAEFFAQSAASGSESPTHAAAEDVLSIAIRVAEEVYGTLYLIGPDRVFTGDDEQLATALAVTAGGAIANARLFTESELRRRWLSASGDLTNELLSVSSVRPLTRIARAAMAAASADFATLVVPGLDADLIVEAISGALAADLVGRSTPIAGSLAGRAFALGKPALISDYRTEARQIAVTADTGPVIIVPLAVGEQTRGVLTLGRLTGRVGFTEADLGMAASFAVQAAVALELADARDAQLRTARMDDHDRIAFDLHDHVIQELFALGMGLQSLAGLTKPTVHVARINGYVDTLDRVIRTIRTSIFHLGAHRHDPAGLQQRILDITDGHTEQLGFSPSVHFSGTLDLSIGEALSDDLVAVTREALSNCARHARASSVVIGVSLAGGVVTLEVTDNGRGLGTPTRSSGLTNMRRRAERHSGGLETEVPDGGGTRLTWTAYLDAEHMTPEQQTG